MTNKGWFEKGSISWNKGKRLSEETKKKMSESHKGKILSEEHKKNLSKNHKGMKGKHHSEETKKKLSESLKGRKISEEQREKFLKNYKKGMKGNHHSEETKKKIGEKNKGKLSGENNHLYGVKKIGKKNPNWKGGKTIDGEGYTHIRIPYRDVREHRLIVEKILGRLLTENEVVHHIDENRSNNINSNLLACSRGYHQLLHKKLKNKKGNNNEI